MVELADLTPDHQEEVLPTLPSDSDPKSTVIAGYQIDLVEIAPRVQIADPLRAAIRIREALAQEPIQIG